jgi:hypothetical protein
MWKNDPFKAKRTIAAKAYSSIRDVVGKQRASLLAFLTLVCPKIGMINAEDYFWKMNWKLEAAVDGTKVLKQTSFLDLSSFGADILYTKRRYTFLRTDVLHSPASRQPNCLGGQLQPNWILTKESDISAELAGFVPSGPTARPIYEFDLGRRSSRRQLTSLLPVSRKWLGSISGTFKMDRIYV